MACKNFLDLADAGTDTIQAMLEDAIRRKTARANRPKGEVDKDAPLTGYTLGMIFEKNSTRTRVSFDMAMRQLGGSVIALDGGGMQLGRGETMADTGRVLSRYCDALMIRTDQHEKAVELAQHATIPVINGLTSKSHPCQIMADMMTVQQHFGYLAGTRWAWLGDGNNNVLHSIIEAASLMGFEVRVACPPEYDPCQQVMSAALKRGAKVQLIRDPKKAVAGAEVVVTDTWVSMGQDRDQNKLRALMPYQVTQELMAAASRNSIFLHCLPAHRGEEVVDEVIDGPQSVVWDEAENRLHAQKSVLLWALGRLS
ncbi:aspartate/ornithine carbamoyltransferase, asp/Orn binding domain-containing protein [Ditylenchus destructor]|uniref:ornithine carbamoyltransferase n=1 Tax=Ditylenchus destructor TaxID=166010 RepID=A0AAD4MVT6_9BILA|nr:aspartate/ornithine carbamoyltransferase, asp/Orn binding domain-containing protein [Ditylenchus destructor]